MESASSLHELSSVSQHNNGRHGSAVWLQLQAKPRGIARRVCKRVITTVPEWLLALELRPCGRGEARKNSNWDGGASFHWLFGPHDRWCPSSVLLSCRLAIYFRLDPVKLYHHIIGENKLVRCAGIMFSLLTWSWGGGWIEKNNLKLGVSKKSKVPKVKKSKSKLSDCQTTKSKLFWQKTTETDLCLQYYQPCYQLE